jgi:hypothetical protein
MADTEQQEWRKQFEANGRDAVLTLCHDGSYNGPKRLAAFQWLREKQRASDRFTVVALFIGVATLFVAAATLFVAIKGLR